MTTEPTKGEERQQQSANNQNNNEDGVPPLSMVLPQLDAKQMRSKMQQRRRRNRSSMGSGGVGELAMSGGDLTSLAYSASTASGGNGNDTKKGGGRHHERGTTMASSQGGIFSVASDSTDVGADGGAGGHSGNASASVSASASASASASGASEFFLSNNKDGNKGTGQTAGESIFREKTGSADASALSTATGGASSADDIIISPSPSYNHEEAAKNNKTSSPAPSPVPSPEPVSRSRTANSDITRSPNARRLSPSHPGLPPASPPLARPKPSMAGNTSPNTTSPYSSPNRPRSHISPNQRYHRNQNQLQVQHPPSSGRGGEASSPSLSNKSVSPVLSPLQGQQISPGLSPAFSPAGTISPGGSPGGSPRHQLQSRRGSGKQPPRIPVMNHRQHHPPTAHQPSQQSSPAESEAEGSRTSVGGNSNYSFRPRFESSDSFVVRKKALVVDSSGNDSDYQLPTPPNQQYGGGGLPPQPTSGGSGILPPRRQRLGTDEIIGNAPPAHDFFGSYREISPTTGTMRLGQSTNQPQQQQQQQQQPVTQAFFGQSAGIGTNSSTTPTSNQGSNSTFQSSPSGVYFGDSADELGSHADGSIVFTSSFDGTGAAGPANRQRLGSRDGGFHHQSQSQYKQQHGRASSWGQSSTQESLVRVDSQKNMNRQQQQSYYHPHSPRNDPYPSPSAPSLNNYGSTPIGALPYHQRRKLMQRRREEEERVAYQQQEEEKYQQRMQNSAGDQRRYPPYRRGSSKQKSRGQRPPTPTNNDQSNLPPRNQMQKGSSYRRKSPTAAGAASGPPPHPNPYHSRTPTHIRAESTGSVSSLGSAGPGSLHADQLKVMTDQLGRDIKGFLQGGKKKDQYQQQEKPPKGQGFFAGIFGAERSPSPVNVSVEDYHNRNQAFLQKTAPQREYLAQKRRDPSPQRRTRDPSPGPPSVQGMHRARLPSIDADDWADDKDDNSGSKNSGSRSRGSRGQRTGVSVRRGGGRDDAFRSTVRAGNTASARDRRDMDAYGATGFTSSGRMGSSSGDDLNIATRGRSRNIEPIRRTDSDSYFSSDFSGDDESDATPSQSSFLSASSYTDDGSQNVNERTSLLPPPGISSHEPPSRQARADRASSHHDRRSRDRRGRRSRRHRDRRYQDDAYGERRSGEQRSRDIRRQHRSDRRDRHRHRREQEYSDDSEDYELSASSASSSQYRRWARKKDRLLEREKARLIAQWRAEEEARRQQEEANHWYKRFGRWSSDRARRMGVAASKFTTKTGAFISNMPLTINAVALAIATLGVVWFKFAEENLDSCMPVHFHSPQCTFPEFPGCFYCDTSTAMYKVAVYFHYACSFVAGCMAMLFFGKVVLARRVVIDELSSPTTAAPAGLMCMTMVCVFAGRGIIGKVLVTLAASMHLMLAMWYIYMALAYRILPDPSWFPNTIGIGLSAVKTWLYYPMAGHFLMAISLTLICFFFPISIIRVAINNKISAPVGWIQMSAPAVALYALTIMAQPSFEEEHPDVTNFQRVHRMVYLPCMHGLFVLSIIGAISSVQSLFARWGSIRTKTFSPAHAAFCFPTLAHANAVQAYRGAIDAFSGIPDGSPILFAIYMYWVFVLVGGTITTFIITSKFIYHLPEWTQIDVSDEIEPPAPKETMMSEIVLTGETLRQRYVSPAVLQANEAGALVRLPDQYGRSRYVRTRKVTALGFEPIMTILELDEEREKLLDWVAKNPAKQRHRTLSVPGIDFNYGYGDFRGSGVFDGNMAEEGRGSTYLSNRNRSMTHDGGNSDRRRSHTIMY